MPIKLPTAPEPAQFTEPTSLLMYGAPKCGKTSSLPFLPDCLILSLERGAEQHNCMRVPVTTYKEFMEVTGQIAASAGRYKFVAVDTVDVLEELSVQEGQARYKASNMGRTFTGRDILSELEHGAGYRWLRNAFDEALCAVIKCAPHVIFIGHVKDKVLDTGGAKDTIIKDLDLTGKCKNIICARCDAVGHLTRVKRTGSPVSDGMLSFQTNDWLNAGARHTYLAGKTFKFIDGDTVKPDWAAIFPSLKTN